MADRTGYTAAELAEMRLPCLSTASNKVRARAEREGWPFTEEPSRGFRGTVRVYALATLPESIRTAIVEQITTASSAPPLVEAKPEHANVALERFRVVAAVVELVARRERVGAAIESVRGSHSARSVRRWYDAVKDAPRTDWMRMLVPAWKGPTDLDDCHQDAFAVFRDDYLRGSKPSAAECYHRMQRVATANGWAPIPGVAALMRRLRREVSATTIILEREGELALERTYPAQERDKSNMKANDAWNADGHRLDVMVRWPDGVIERPTLVGFQDIASGVMLSWRIDRTENSDLIRLAFADAAVKNGAPKVVSFDNGLAFASKQNTGGCHWRFRGRVKPEEPVGVITQLVEEVRWVLPHHGQSKPIERAWRDLCETISRHPIFEGAYVGSNPTKRPHNFDQNCAVDLEVFLQVVDKLIASHNERKGRRSPMAHGRSLQATYDESVATIERRILSADQQRLLWLSSERVRLRSPDAALRLEKNRYWAPELVAHMGADVIARFDPDALHTGVHIYLASGAYVGWAGCIEKTGYADRQAARNHAQARAAHTKAAKTIAKIETRHSAAEIAAGHLDALGIVRAPEAAPASIIRPNFGAPRLSKAAAIIAEDTTTRQRRDREDADEVAELFRGSFDQLVANDD